MWVFTQYGFFSAVVDKRDETKMVVRSRDRRHLVNLQKRFPRKLQLIAIEEHAGTDYPFRMAMPPQDWAFIMFSVAHNVTYTNFKAEAERNVKSVGRPYVQALHDIWQVLWDVAHPRKKVGVGVWDERGRL